MTSPSRNAPCPCGSGKKYKRCCSLKGSVKRPSEESVRQEHAQFVVFSESMLMNRVEREARDIAHSFDAISGEAVAHLELMYGRVAALLYVGLERAKASGDDVRHTCAIVLTNALKSLTAAFMLLRTGWRLQPYLCLRNGMEATSVVIHLLQQPNDLERFKDGRLGSPKMLKSAKEAIPPIGHMYGILSEEFVHVGKPFRHVQKGNVYTESEWEMWQSLGSISGFAFMLYLVTELTFIDDVAEPQCWARVTPGGYIQQWSVEIKTWREAFVRIYGPHHRGESTDA
jgi:hypothetical protein